MAQSADQPQSFGRLVRELRQQMGLTQEKLAARLGVSFSTLNRWENEHSRPSPLAREKLEQLKRQLE
jgi:putative transcriptional regulator